MKKNSGFINDNSTVQISFSKILMIVGICLLLCNNVLFAQERTPMEEFVNGFPEELAKKTLNVDLSVLLSGGDEAVYFSRRTSEILPTAILPVRQAEMQMKVNLMPKIGNITAETNTFGTLSLDKFLAQPKSYSEAFIVIHKGEIVYEKYPRMRPEDHHVWMSNAKPTASLIIDLLIEEGKIDETKTMGDYVPEFAGTPTAKVRVKDVMDMTTGLNTDETPESRAVPNSIATRTFLAEFGLPFNGKVENLLDVLKEAEPIHAPGDVFQYASATTQLLVYLAEAVEGKRWSVIFDERVWSKVGAEGPLQLHTTPDGIVAAHGLISSSLRDLARFAMLYTPSWNKIATEQVVSDAIIKGIQTGVRSSEYYSKSYHAPMFAKNFNDNTAISNSRQWDMIWPDGDFWKGGMLSQGIYVSNNRDLVIAYFSTNGPDRSIDRFMRPIATSGLFDK